MKSLRENAAELRNLRFSKPARRKLLLKNASKKLVKCICECAHNTLNKNVPLTKAQFKRLAPYKQTLRKLCKRKESLNKKKKIINQSGGFLLPLLTPIIALLLQSVLK